MKKYSTRERFLAREFFLIEKMIRERKGIREIARQLGRSPSSVSRQVSCRDNQEMFLRYGKHELRFSAQRAIASQALKKKGRGAIAKVAKDKALREYLEKSIKDKGWSPQIALGRAKRKGITFSQSISVKTVYNSIYRRDINVELFDLHLKLRRKPKREQRTRQWKRLYGKRIDDRPNISDRKEFGHWETDSILWGRKCAVLVLVERKTRYCKMLKLDSHTAEEVNTKLKSLNINLKTLTADNGPEFSKLIDIVKETYFTHPYSAWEKGSVENINCLIRRFLPRKTPIHKITQQNLTEIETKINNTPRPILDFNTAYELYLNCTS